MRGEKRGHFRGLHTTFGSPPRARGEGRRGGLIGAPRGITPACAGRSRQNEPWLYPATDHPRVRGEKSTRFSYRLRFPGSPPRARGEGCTTALAPASRRITPACAGRREPRCQNCKTQTDHPRVRGEKRRVPGSVKEAKGSPPRARGEVSVVVLRRVRGGITPACAGRSQLYGIGAGVGRDHPRVRGEKSPRKDFGA